VQPLRPPFTEVARSTSRFLCAGTPASSHNLGEICRDLLIAAALTGDWMEAAVGKGLGRTWTAEMDYRGKLPLLLRAGRRP
jgi:hypothetical protein